MFCDYQYDVDEIWAHFSKKLKSTNLSLKKMLSLAKKTITIIYIAFMP